MTREAFTTLSEVKAWLTITDTSSDAILQRLIYMATAAILNYINRDSLLYGDRTFTFDGVGGDTLMLPEWPVHSVSAVTVNDLSIPAATTQLGVGYSFQAPTEPPPGGMQAITMRGYSFAPGLQNISVTCKVGYAVFSEEHTAAETVAVSAPYGEWVQDIAVVYAATGEALNKVAGTPAVGQYALGSTPGTYTFNASEAGTLAISYGFVPSDLADACLELVAERFKYRGRIGERSRSLGGQITASYDLSAIPPFVARVLNNYKKVVPC